MSVSYPDGDQTLTVVQTTLALLVQALDGTPAGCPDRVILAHGEVTYDCEQAWVRLGSVYPSAGGVGRDNEQQTRNAARVPALTVAVEIGVLRCFPMVTEVRGRPVIPTADKTTAASLGLLADARALRAVPTHLWPAPGRVQLAVGGWAPIQPEGGLAGGTLSFNAPIVDCAPIVD